MIASEKQALRTSRWLSVIEGSRGVMTF